jgi:hypothetical protein
MVYATTYWGLKEFFDSNFPAMNLIGSGWIEFGDFIVPVLIHGAQVTIGCAFLAAWIAPQAVAMRTLFALGTLFTLISTDASGYALAFPLYLVFFERWEGPARITALVCAYILSIPADWTFSPLGYLTLNSWLAGAPVLTNYGVTFGPILRPGVVIICGCALAAATIADVVRFRHAKRNELATTEGKAALQLES